MVRLIGANSAIVCRHPSFNPVGVGKNEQSVVALVPGVIIERMPEFSQKKSVG
jgi:hypothetical protein